MKLAIAFLLVFIIECALAQTIDTLNPNFIRIEYWQKFDTLDFNNVGYVEGYSLFCNCDKVKSSDSSALTENSYLLISGKYFNGLKSGDWQFYSKGIVCCAEITPELDSIVTYKDGLIIKKVDRRAIFHYNSKEQIVYPLYVKDNLYYKIICINGKCSFEVNCGYKIKQFGVEDLEYELKQIANGLYDFEAIQLINDSR